MLEEETSKTNLEVGKRGDQGDCGLRNRKNSFWRNANKKLILQLNHGFFLFFRSTAHKKEWLQSGKFLWVEESLDNYELQSVTCMSTLVDLIASLCWMIASSLKTLFTPQLMGSIPSSTSPPPSSTSISSLPLVLGRKASTSSETVIFESHPNNLHGKGIPNSRFRLKWPEMLQLQYPYWNWGLSATAYKIRYHKHVFTNAESLNVSFFRIFMTVDNFCTSDFCILD